MQCKKIKKDKKIKRSCISNTGLQEKDENEHDHWRKMQSYIATIGSAFAAQLDSAQIQSASSKVQEQHNLEKAAAEALANDLKALPKTRLDPNIIVSQDHFSPTMIDRIPAQQPPQQQKVCEHAAIQQHGWRTGVGEGHMRQPPLSSPAPRMPTATLLPFRRASLCAHAGAEAADSTEHQDD